MAKEVTTIYIDDAAVWVLRAKGRQVLNWGSIPLEPGLVKDGTVHSQERVAQKVREVWQSQKMGASKVIGGISGINCLYRLLSLPELPKELLPEAIRREAERVLGVPLEQLYLSWQTLPSSRGETLVYLVALPKGPVDALVATLRLAGLNPYLMDLRPLALARTVTESKAIVVDLQAAGFDIVIMVDCIPQVARSLSLIREASLEEKATVIRQELDRAITFYNSGHMDRPIDASVPLFVSGELAERQDVWKILTGRVERSVRVLPLPIEAPENFPAGQYVTNVGLALKAVFSSEKGAVTYSLVNFNALPETYIPKPRPLSEILFVPTMVAGIILVAFGAYFNITASAYTESLRDNLASINQRIISQHVRAQDVIALSRQVSSLEEAAAKFTGVRQSLAAGREEMNTDLAEINRVVGKDILSITHDGKTIVVQGSAGEDKTLLGYAKELRASGRFAQVIITTLTREEDGFRFTLSLTK